jgi:hypothetical protein
VTIRLSARIAGLAVLAAEASAVATQATGLPARTIWATLIALQCVGVLWATDRRAADTLRNVAPAGLAAVTVAALWTTLALAIPVTATDDVAAVVAIVAAGLVVAVFFPRHEGQRRLPLGLVSAAGSAMLILLSISWILPSLPGFVSDNHPPTYTDVTRLVDPVLEAAIFILLAGALGVDGLRARLRSRRAAARSTHVAGLNEMVVEPAP